MNVVQLQTDSSKELSTRKSVSMLTREELVDVFGKELKRQHIDTITDLLNWLKFDLPMSDDYSTEAYISLLKKELSSKASDSPSFHDSFSLGNYLASKYADLEIEELHLLSVNAANQIIADDCLSRGTKSQSLVDPGVIIKKLAINNATGFFLTHNHPSGKLTPSKDDIETTKRLITLTNFMQVTFMDHIITGNGQYLSMEERDYI